MIHFGPFSLFVRERRLEREEQKVKLGSRALDVLIVLAQRDGEVVSNEELNRRVWPNTSVEDNNLRVHVTALRKALGDINGHARYVTNVPGRGYCFIGRNHLASRSRASPVIQDRMDGIAIMLATAQLKSGAAPYAQHIQIGLYEIVADEPAAQGGSDAGPRPYGLLLSALAACTSTTLQMYAARKGWALGSLAIDLSIVREDESERIVRKVVVSSEVTSEQRARLAEIADKTPVTKTMKRGTSITTTIVTASPAPPG